VQRESDFPQGLKPTFHKGRSGTAEAVPFQNWLAQNWLAQDWLVRNWCVKEQN